MAKTGRPSKPTQLRVLHGDKLDRFPKGEPIPDEGPIEPPAALSAEALAVWQSLAPDLQRKGVLTPWDVHIFGMYCQTVVYAYEAEALLNRSSVLLRSANRSDVKGGMAVKNPAVQVWRDMAQLAARLGGQFGLTPSDRVQLASGEQRGALPGEHLLTH